MATNPFEYQALRTVVETALRLVLPDGPIEDAAVAVANLLLRHFAGESIEKLQQEPLKRAENVDLGLDMDRVDLVVQALQDPTKQAPEEGGK